MSTPQPRFLYIFLDEAGNLVFSKNGTKYFVLGGITKERPFHAYKELTELKYDLVQRGMGLEYFHAAEDNQTTRNQVFDIIEKNLADVAVDSIIVEKQKVVATLRADEQFYPKLLGTLLQEILKHYPLAEAMQTGQPYQTRLDPPPADPRGCHPPKSI